MVLESFLITVIQRQLSSGDGINKLTTIWYKIVATKYHQEVKAVFYAWLEF